MRTTRLRHLAASTLGVAALTLAGLPATPAAAAIVSGDMPCFAPDMSSSARGGYGPDTRAVSADQQRAISRRTDRILDQGRRPAAGTTVPVYVHVMAAADGAGDVTDAAVAEQIAVLNTTFGGQESADAAQTGFTFSLAGVDRFYNDTWHRDGSPRSTAS